MNPLILRWNRRLCADLSGFGKTNLATKVIRRSVLVLREGGISMQPDHRYPSPIGRRGLPQGLPPVFCLDDAEFKPLRWQGFADAGSFSALCWNKLARSCVIPRNKCEGIRTCSGTQSNGSFWGPVSSGFRPVATRWVSRRLSVVAQGLRVLSSRMAIRLPARLWVLRRTLPIAGPIRTAADRYAAQAACIGTPATQDVAKARLTAQRVTERNNSKAVRAFNCTGGLFHADTAGLSCGTLD